MTRVLVLGIGLMTGVPHLVGLETRGRGCCLAHVLIGVTG